MAAEKEKTVLKIINLRHPADQKIDLKELLISELAIDGQTIAKIRILRRATDARQERIDFVYTVLVTLVTDHKVIQKLTQRQDVAVYHEKEVERPLKISGLTSQPVIVGCGPAGLFAALTLIERGVQPIVLERGERITERVKTVDAFWKEGILNPESNVLFGEGGAGTFSDGKLTTRIKSELKEKVFKTLVRAGADSEILYLHKPHIGTDRLRRIIPGIVDELQAKGAVFLFGNPVTDILQERGQVTGVVAGTTIKSSHVFLATGHSARDMYRLISTHHAVLEPKGFAVGLRIEHPREFIDKQLLGAWAGRPELGPADYFYSYKDAAHGRSVYTFCMCPGGLVIGCSTEDCALYTNGMSVYMRNTEWSNAAVVVSVHAGDYSITDPLEGIRFQEHLEQEAFSMGGGSFHAPVQRACDFVQGIDTSSTTHNIACSYRPGIAYGNLKNLLPQFLYDPLRMGLIHMNKKLPGFIDEGLMIGIETRTSSPVRILRDMKNYHTANLHGLIPVGEGSGYAGGIVSSAVDGIQGAMRFTA